MGRVKPTTSWNKRPNESTSWNPRQKPQSDLTYLTNNLLNRVTNNAGKRILIHTGNFYERSTDWCRRNKPTTTWN